MASRHTVSINEIGETALREMERLYLRWASELGPMVYYRLTDNSVEMTVRFIVRDHGIRDQKDALSREILAGMQAAGIGVASSTFEIAGLSRCGSRARRPAWPPRAGAEGPLDRARGDCP